MKSIASFLGSSIAAGACAAFLLSLVSPEGTPGAKENVQFRQSGLAMRNVLAALHEVPAVQAIESAVVKVAEAVIPTAKPGSAVMLLSEPVVILTASTNGWQRLEAGKKVTLVANEGRFIRVKYDEKEVSIPRTAVTQGIASIQ